MNNTQNAYFNNQISADFSVVHAAQVIANRVCVVNRASFDLKWWVNDLFTGSDSLDSGLYGYSETRCMSISINGIQNNDKLNVIVHPIGGSSQAAITDIIYQKLVDVTAIYTCTGTVDSYECSMTETTTQSVLEDVQDVFASINEVVDKTKASIM
jgi:hypothetical protein